MVMFHATDIKNLESILDKGIQPGSDGLVYLTAKFNEAAVFPLLHGVPEKEVVVLECHLPESRIQETFDHSREYFNFPCYGYPKVINPVQIHQILEVHVAK